MTNINPVGSYSKQGAYLVSNQYRFVVGKRQTTAPNKPTYFLTYKPEGHTAKPVYISSLYPTTNGSYEIEFQGVRYCYIDSGERVTITKL